MEWQLLFTEMLLDSLIMMWEGDYFLTAKEEKTDIVTKEDKPMERRKLRLKRNST